MRRPGGGGPQRSGHNRHRRHGRRDHRSHPEERLLGPGLVAGRWPDGGQGAGPSAHVLHAGAAGLAPEERIEEERLAKEGETLYTALLVRAGEMAPLRPAELWAGKNTSAPLRGEWLDQWIARTGRALEGMARARGEETASRRWALEEVRSGLVEMKKEWEQWQR